MKNQKDFPLQIKISFHKLIEQYRKQVEVEPSSISREYLEKMLDYVLSFPKLADGIANTEELVKFKAPIKILLKDLFPGILSENEIKAISIPFHNFIFNPTKKFRQILDNAGEDFELTMRNFHSDLNYIFGCILILNSYYGYKLDFSRPLYYDIPDKKGFIRHYRISLNSEFMEIIPTEKAKKISEEDVDKLIRNLEDVELWKEMFPIKSWIFHGFTIISLTDVTVDDAISDLKTTLLYQNSAREDELQKFEEIFRSIYKIADLKVGITLYNEKESVFQRMSKKARSFILDIEGKKSCSSVLGERALNALVKEHENFPISNVVAFAKETSDNPLSVNLQKRGAKSAILAPIAKNGKLLGILELISFKKNELNSINATKLDDILPYLVTAMERNRIDYENRVKAVIQSECTSIHPSVLWAFEDEAKRFIRDIDEDGLASFKDIAFDDIYPLYGQIDIVASSEARNNAIQKDLLFQLKFIKEIVEKANEVEVLPIYEQVNFRLDDFIGDLQKNLNASSEQKVFNLLNKEIKPILLHIEKQNTELKDRVSEYRKMTNPETGVIYDNRKDYDEAVQQINRTMSRYIDRKQVEAQKIFPHYFERYKTDGVDHNIYLGASLSNDPKKVFDKVYLYSLRLWQLSTMCEMENGFYKLQENLPLSLDAASLILVFNNTLSIRYRMDEKRFDVDGTYNARFEIIKKRIDKACIKGTEERVAKKGKIAIVYSQGSDEREYLRYIKYLQKKHYLGEEVELLELEDVQGVIGLRAIRVNVLYNLDELSPEVTITYEDLINELK